MRKSLIFLLAASLLANGLAAIWWLQLRSNTASATAAVDSLRALPAAPDRPAAAAAGSAAATATPTWAEVKATGNFSSLVAQLRTLGLPPHLLRLIVQMLVYERSSSRMPGANRPFWMIARQDKENQKIAQDISRENQALVDSLLGPESGAGAMNPVDRERRYGNLPVEKVNALMKIERDYQEVLGGIFAEANGRSMTREDASRLQQRQEMVEKEKQADLAALLSPAELEEFSMRNSPSAWTTIQGLRDVDVSEAEYRALYRLQKAFDQANPASALLGSKPEQMDQRLAATLQLYDQMAAALPDDRFYAVLAARDQQYAEVARFTASYPAITPATSYQVFQAQQALQAAYNVLNRNQSLDNAARVEQRQTLAAAYEARLTALIGPAATAAYRQTTVGKLMLPSTPTPSPPKS